MSRWAGSVLLAVGIAAVGCGAAHTPSPSADPAGSTPCHSGWSTCLTRLASETEPGVLGPRVASGDTILSSHGSPAGAAASVIVSYQYAFAGLPQALVSVIAVSQKPLVVKNFTSYDHESWTMVRGHRGIVTNEPATGRHILVWNERGRQWSAAFPGNISARDARRDVAAFTAYGA